MVWSMVFFDIFDILVVLITLDGATDYSFFDSGLS